MAALSSSFISSLVKVTNFLVLSAESEDMNSISTCVPDLPLIKSTTSSILQPTTSTYSFSLDSIWRIRVILSSGNISPDFSAGPPGTKLTIFV